MKVSTILSTLAFFGASIASPAAEAEVAEAAYPPQHQQQQQQQQGNEHYYGEGYPGYQEHEGHSRGRYQPSRNRQFDAEVHRYVQHTKNELEAFAVKTFFKVFIAPEYPTFAKAYFESYAKNLTVFGNNEFYDYNTFKHHLEAVRDQFKCRKVEDLRVVSAPNGRDGRTGQVGLYVVVKGVEHRQPVRSTVIIEQKVDTECYHGREKKQKISWEAFVASDKEIIRHHDGELAACMQ